MSRAVTQTVLDALGNQNSYKMIARMEVFPSRVHFSSLTRDFAVPAADDLPASDNPMRQEVAYNATPGLVTFYADGDLKYAIDGNATPVTSDVSASYKPGVYGSKIYVANGDSVDRKTISWSAINSRSTSPFSQDANIVTTDTPLAVHGVSETECVAITDADGGFGISYISGTTEYLSDIRFMFPSAVEWDGSTRTMAEMGLFSAAGKLGNRIFIYISNAASGMVQGVFYDLDTATWSDVFTAMPTDLDVSLCEFRVANSFTRNNKIYIVGQLIRTDILGTNAPYTLILASDDGLTFSIDRFSMVSDLGYRFLGTVGSDNNLYLSNCNRVCEAASTWVFDGDNDTSSPKTLITMGDFIDFADGGLENATLSLPAGDESIFNDPNYQVGSRVKVFVGYETSAGNEYFLYGTYIVAKPKIGFANGVRTYDLNMIIESRWKGSGLSMPFYAEILGLSTLYDPMTEAAGKLYAASSGVRTTTFFSVDFWQSEAYTNATEGITGKEVVNAGGVDVVTATGNHKQGFILKQDISSILTLTDNPEITATTVNAKVYGWSQSNANGAENDLVNLIVVTTDADGGDEQYHFTNQSTEKWSITYPWERVGNDPVNIAITGMTVGRRIKRIGVIMECATTTTYVIGRVDVVDGVEASISLELGNTPWEASGDGTFKVPSGGQPFIMFAQRPYHAWNFHLMALFENTVTGGITGYATATGLVGLAIDAANYILARYDKTSAKVQLVKVVAGIETILAQAAPGWSLGDTHGMQFIHKDGTFKVLMLNEGTSRYESVLTYSWTAADGFMYTDRIATRKCGIYGAILSPILRILAYAPGGQDSTTNADGIAIDPLYDHTDFPTTGKLRVGNNIYSYGGKVAASADIVEGPYQLRNTNVSYPPPYGTGGAGVENRYFNWTAGANKWKDTFIAINNGAVFKIDNSDWHIYITTGGVVQWLRNRSRHYSANKQIGRVTATTAAKCWMGAGGFDDISLLSGTSARESNGSYAMLELDGSIKCYWYMGSGGEADTTIRDLINKVAKYSGTSSTFPGDSYTETLVVNGEVDIATDDYAEGFDMEFKIDTPQSFEIRTNIKLDGTNYEEATAIENDTGLKVVITSLGSGAFRASIVCTPSSTTMYEFEYTSGTSEQQYRFLFHENNLTIYQNARWVASIAFDSLIYTQTTYVDVKMYTASSVSIRNLWVRDLNDWREAVYIDLETDASSAIASVIQERPVEIQTNPDGTLRSYYEATRPELTLLTDPYSHDIDQEIPTGGASDAIIYGSHDVKTIVSHQFAADFGFSTKVMRFPNLNVGAVEAGYRTLERAYQNRKKHSLSIRPDIRIVPGDILHTAYNLSATGKWINESIIVEDVSLKIRAGDEDNFTWSMSVKGRQYDA